MVFSLIESSIYYYQADVPTTAEVLMLVSRMSNDNYYYRYRMNEGVTEYDFKSLSVRDVHSWGTNESDIARGAINA